ncbi:helix-turn-helix domain-containing protein [Bacillus massiliigorillae]|uniref:helix-turn-helix domain-containing protein n=1 Tax=Bacillus massiliigorillae TaxID=1243664 RepID=UPI0003A16C64|nr:helix-turn-helix transcriptional regulator [Bacillus massiliigorillae]
MNVNQYNTFAEFITDFMLERGLTQKELGEIMHVSGAMINHLKQGRRLPRELSLRALESKYEELNFSELQKLVNRSKTKKVAKKGDNPIKEKTKDLEVKKIKDDQPQTSSSNEIDNSVIHKESEEQTQDNPMLTKLLNQLSERPELITPLLNLTKYSDDIQREVIEHIHDFAESSISNKVQKVTHKEFKKYFVDTSNKWIKETKPIGYEGKSNEELEDISVVGHLQLSNTGLFFALEITKDYLLITTRQQDKEHINEYMNLISGFKITTRSYGNLGNIYSSGPINTVHIFKPSPFVSNVKNILKTKNIHFNKSTFENDSYEVYFK